MNSSVVVLRKLAYVEDSQQLTELPLRKALIFDTPLRLLLNTVWLVQHSAIFTRLNN